MLANVKQSRQLVGNMQMCRDIQIELWEAGASRVCLWSSADVIRKTWAPETERLVATFPIGVRSAIR